MSYETAVVIGTYICYAKRELSHKQKNSGQTLFPILIIHKRKISYVDYWTAFYRFVIMWVVNRSNATIQVVSYVLYFVWSEI